MASIMTKLLPLLDSGGNSRVGSRGNSGKFSQLFNSILKSNTTQRPRAFVNKGKEVTFENMLFVDTKGHKLKITDTEVGSRTRLSIKSSKKVVNDKQLIQNLQKENRLNSNYGVDQVIPNFRDMVQKHLDSTRELRHNILTGKIKTPGQELVHLPVKDAGENELNPKEHAKAIADVMLKNGKGNSLKSGSASAIIQGLSSNKKGNESAQPSENEIKAEMDKVRKKLPHPLEKNVQPFDPPHYNSKSNYKKTQFNQSENSTSQNKNQAILHNGMKAAPGLNDKPLNMSGSKVVSSISLRQKSGPELSQAEIQGRRFAAIRNSAKFNDDDSKAKSNKESAIKSLTSDSKIKLNKSSRLTEKSNIKSKADDSKDGQATAKKANVSNKDLDKVKSQNENIVNSFTNNVFEEEPIVLNKKSTLLKDQIAQSNGKKRDGRPANARATSDNLNKIRIKQESIEKEDSGQKVHKLGSNLNKSKFGDVEQKDSVKGLDESSKRLNAIRDKVLQDAKASKWSDNNNIKNAIDVGGAELKEKNLISTEDKNIRLVEKFKDAKTDNFQTSKDAENHLGKAEKDHEENAGIDTKDKSVRLASRITREASPDAKRTPERTANAGNIQKPVKEAGSTKAGSTEANKHRISVDSGKNDLLENRKIEAKQEKTQSVRSFQNSEKESVSNTFNNEKEKIENKKIETHYSGRDENEFDKKAIKEKRSEKTPIQDQRNARQSFEGMVKDGWHIRMPKKSNSAPKSLFSKITGGWRSNVSDDSKIKESAIDTTSDMKNKGKSKNISGDTSLFESKVQEKKDQKFNIANQQENNTSNSGKTTTAQNLSQDTDNAVVNNTKVEAKIEQQPNVTNNHKNEAPRTAQDTAQNIRNLNDVLKKIEGNAKLLTENGKTTIKVNLKPAELGRLLVHIQEDDKKYTVKIVAESHEAAKAIESQAVSVKELLAENGVKVDSFEVQTNTDKSNSEGQSNKNSSNGNDRRNSRGQSGQEFNSDAELADSSGRRLNLGTNTVEYLG